MFNCPDNSLPIASLYKEVYSENTILVYSFSVENLLVDSIYAL